MEDGERERDGWWIDRWREIDMRNSEMSGVGVAIGIGTGLRIDI